MREHTRPLGPLDFCTDGEELGHTARCSAHWANESALVYVLGGGSAFCPLEESVLFG